MRCSKANRWRRLTVFGEAMKTLHLNGRRGTTVIALSVADTLKRAQPPSSTRRPRL
jgi:hypothetical protein